MIFTIALEISITIPIAAATGYSIKKTSLAFDLSKEYITALRSTTVTTEGTQITIIGLERLSIFILFIKH